MNPSIFKYLIAYLLAVCLNGTNAFGQKESANWYFGDLAGLNFSNGTPEILTDGQLITSEGCATISDPQGNLLFYTDGTSVWDRKHQIMQNGMGLLGHSSSTMSALIIPKPGNFNAFYIFTIDKPSYFLTQGQPIDGVNYSEVDMSLNNGFGDIVTSNKNSPLITYDVNNPEENRYKSSEKITAVTHSDGSSVWVLTQFINKFYAFRVDLNGVNSQPVVSTVDQTVYPRINDVGANISAIGYMKLSPDGKKLAIAHSATSLGSPRTGTKRSGSVLLYDFNNATGLVSNQRQIISDTYPYGVEFSPNSKLLYITVSNFTEADVFIDSNLYQYNLESSSIKESQYNVKTSPNVAGALQLAIDGKIYRAGYEVFQKGGKALSVINTPNTVGNGINYAHNSINLGPNRTAELGLPPFVQSIFKFTFDYEFICFGDNTHYFITSEDPYDTVVWDFGDGNTSTLEEPYHTYAKPGTYTVSLSLTINGITNDPLIKQITISEPPKVMQTAYALTQCDSFDDDATDGISTFNLEIANDPLTFNTADNSLVYYYQDKIEAINDTTNTKSLPLIYTNQSQGEILHAKVYRKNTACYSLATVKLITSQAIDLKVFQLQGCDIENNGQGVFDLELARMTIRSALNLTGNVTILFYKNEIDASIGVVPVADQFRSPSTTLFVRAESDFVCYGTGILKLDVRSFPLLEDQTIMVCQSDFPILIDSNLELTQQQNYNYVWSTGQHTNSIMVSQPGSYQLLISDPILHCETTVNVQIIQNDIAVIKNITIVDATATIELDQPVEGFEFAIDDAFGAFQSSPFFTNLAPGTHTIFVRDLAQCTTISEVFYMLGFPKYFTPNNDAQNEFWNITGIDPTSTLGGEIHIFNRYGKLLFSFKPQESEGWDGTYNGQLLSPDDYWYTFKTSDNKLYRGHFSLKI